MDLLSVMGSLGESVLNIIAERLTMNSVSIKAAWMRPVNDPFSAKINVTKGFIDLIHRQLVLTDHQTTPQQLSDASVAHAMKLSLTGYRHVTAPTASGSWWLCVSFVVPGGISYVACYILPEEPITFPPQTLCNTINTIIPIHKQILTASITRMNRDQDDEGQEDILLDISQQFRSMSGPDGTAFGRGRIDVKLAMANTIEDISDKQTLLCKLFAAIAIPSIIQTIINTADGEQRPANGYIWICPD